MCGIVGLVGNMYKRDVDYFTNALVVDSLRGFDSTGVAAMRRSTVKGENSHVVHYIKDVVTGAEAVRDKEFTSTYNNHQNYAVIGHNRAATMGSIDVDNAHPFLHSPICLVHNGTLTSTLNLDGNFDTDSEHICYTLSNTDDKKAVLERITGAFALAWFDLSDSTINLARNDERPLYVCKNADETCMYFASEANILRFCAYRAGIKLKGDPVELPVGEWWSIDVSDIKHNSVIEPNIVEFKPKKKTYSYQKSSYSRSGYTYHKKPANAPKSGDTVEIIIEEIGTPIHNPKNSKISLTGTFFAEGDDEYKATVFSLDKSRVPGIQVGDIISAEVSTFVYTCQPPHIYLRADTIKLVDDWSSYMSSKAHHKDGLEQSTVQCANCLQYVVDNHEHRTVFRDNIVACNDCVDFVATEFGYIQ